MNTTQLRERFRAALGRKDLRGAPFWSWNDRLDPEQLRRQVREMKAAGLGGFFMHARIGLVTPYMSDQWMECIQAAVDEAKRVGLDPWLYDEDCWPSGSASGEVAKGGKEHWVKTLALEETTAADLALQPTTIAVFACRRDGDELTDLRRLHPQGELSSAADDMQLLHFYYRESDSYVDLLNAATVRRFLNLAYEPYARELGPEIGSVVPGIFTDEPKYRYPPWSEALPQFFQDLYGYDLLEHLPALYFPISGCHRVRYHFWSAVCRLLEQSFSKQVGKWCSDHGLILTGHYNAEDNLPRQITNTGAVMPHYESMQMPGIDHLGRRIADPLLPKQVSSVARQLGRRALSEMFGCAGWNVSFEELKWIADWQFVLGIDFPCQHLSLYSARGCRKRDYPPSLHYQQPWWSDYPVLNDYFARLLSLVTAGEAVADILVLHTSGSAWAVHQVGDLSPLAELNEALVRTSEYLLSAQRDFDYGDETILERHARVEGEQLAVGRGRYRLVVVPPSVSWRENTLKLLQQFMEAGGTVICCGQQPEMIEGQPDERVKTYLSGAVYCGDDRAALLQAVEQHLPRRLEVKGESGEDLPYIYYQQRELEDGTTFLLTNISQQEQCRATISFPGTWDVELLDLDTGATCLLCTKKSAGQTQVTLSFPAMTSRALLLNPPSKARQTVEGRAVCNKLAVLTGESTLTTVASLEGEWQLELLEENVLTLDYCRYRLPGADWRGPLPVIWLQAKLEEEDYEGPVELEFDFTVEQTARDQVTQLVLEQPRRFDVKVNGAAVSSEDVGAWHDIAFRRLDLGGLVQAGKNTVSLATSFTRGGNRDRSGEPLAEKTELESIYILGSFGLQPAGEVRPLPRRALSAPGPFTITTVPDEVRAGDLTGQGLWFYSGRVRLRKTVELPRELASSEEPLWLEMDVPDAIVTRILVNGHEAGRRAWRPYRFSLEGLLSSGRNEFSIELTGSMRNALGPHHHIDGELHFVGPGSFTGKKSWTDRSDAPASTWTDEYSFVRFGLNGAPRLCRQESDR